MGRRIIACMASAILALTSCMKEAEPDGQPDGTQEKSTVTFRMTAAERTRSSISPDEEGLRDVTIAAYRDGRLFATATGSRPSMEIVLGYSYNLYALANCGRVDPPLYEDSFRSQVIRINGIADLQDGIPMVWSHSGWTPSPHSQSQQIDIVLERMASRISFSLDKGTLSGLTVESVRLMNSPVTVRPFVPEGSRALSSSEVGNGDYASTADLQRLNAGEPILFYTLENCQGTLLPGNTDPWKKVPEQINGKAGLCTWIEVKGTFAPGHFYSGKVTYRIYPGRDNCTDFTLGRNTDIGITLYVTGPGLKQISWKVDANISIDPTSASATVDGMHSKDDLYIGERFDCVLDVSRELLDYLGGNLDGLRLEFLPSGQTGAIELGSLSRDGSDLQYRCRACCLEKGAGDLYLVDRDGSRLMKVCRSLSIWNPEIAVSTRPGVGDSERSDSFEMTEIPTLTINGQPETFHLYFTDSWGYNLNATGSDYNLDLFDFSTILENDLHSVGKSVVRSLTRGTSSSGGPAVSCMTRSVNGGSDGALNRNLCSAIAEPVKALDITVTESNHRLRKSVGCGMSTLPVEVTIVDNGWARYFNTMNSVKVKNPSNIELYIDFMQVMSSRHSLFPPPSDADIRKILEKISIKEVECIRRGQFNGSPDLDPNVHYNHQEPLFIMEGRRIVSNPAGGYGDTKTKEGDYIIHPVENLDADHLNDGRIVTKDNCGTALLNDMLFNLIRVDAPYMDFYPALLTCHDMLSDGSMQYEMNYGKDDGGFNDRGIWSWAGLFSDEKATTDLDPYGVEFQDIKDLRTPDMDITLVYDSSTGKVYATSTNPRQLTLDFRFTVKCKGYCRVKPEGAGSKEHFPTESVTRTVTGIMLGNGRVCVDNGALKEAMDLVYARTYQHRDRPLAKRKYIHATPDEVQLTVQARISGGYTASESVNFNMTNLVTVMYYHEQNSRNCIVTSDIKTGNYKICYVDLK